MINKIPQLLVNDGAIISAEILSIFIACFL